MVKNHPATKRTALRRQLRLMGIRNMDLRIADLNELRRLRRHVYLTSADWVDDGTPRWCDADYE